MSKLSDKAIQGARTRAKFTQMMASLAGGEWLTLLVTPRGIGRWKLSDDQKTVAAD